MRDRIAEARLRLSRYPVSEDLLLGLGRGLGFACFHIKGTDPFYGGRANVARPGEEGLEKTAGRRTGVAVQSHATSSAGKAQDTLRELLEAQEPVLIYLDMGMQLRRCPGGCRARPGHGSRAGHRHCRP